ANGELKMIQLAYAEAAYYYRQATEIVEQMPAGSEEPLARFLNDWGNACYAAGDYRGVESLLQRALAIRGKVLGTRHPDDAPRLNNLATVCYAEGCYSEAEPLYQRALAIREKVLGGEHPDVIASLNSLATLYYAQGRYSETESLYQRALALCEAVLGGGH